MVSIWADVLTPETVGYFTVALGAIYFALFEPFGLDGWLLVLVGTLTATLAGLLAACARSYVGEVFC